MNIAISPQVTGLRGLHMAQSQIEQFQNFKTKFDTY